MDDIIVIILTLIIAVVGAIGQIKKKKQGQANEVTSQKEPENFWDLLNADQENPVEQDEDIVESFDIQQETKTEPEIIKSPSPKYEFTAENEGKPIYDSELTEPQNLVKQKNKKIKKSFSLKKAVIYSEILNRKYD